MVKRSGYGVAPLAPLEAGVMARMKRSEVAVYHVLCAYANRKTWFTYPGVKRMAQQIGLSARAVYAALPRLLELGLIRVESQGGGRGKRTVYRIMGNSEHPFALSEPETVNRPARNGDGTAQETVNACAPTPHEQLLNSAINQNREKPLGPELLGVVLQEMLKRSDSGCDWRSDLKRFAVTVAEPFASQIDRWIAAGVFTPQWLLSEAKDVAGSSKVRHSGKVLVSRCKEQAARRHSEKE